MPNEIKWTPEQERAITYRGGAAIVSAAAGSGKTAVLVERVKRLILDESDPVNADEMVISTFTNEAAAELKARLNKAIDDELAKRPHDRRLIDQRIRLGDAYISTISSFCLTLLRRNSTLAGLRPGFSVLDESEAQLIYNRSLAAVMEEFCESGDPAERELLYDWFAGETDKRIEDAVNILYRFSKRIPDPEKFFADQLGYYRDPSSSVCGTSGAAKRFLVKNVIHAAEKMSAICDELILSAEFTQAEPCAHEWRVLCDAALCIKDAESCEDIYCDLLTEELPALPRVKDQPNDEYVKALHKELKGAWSEFMLHAGLFARRKGDLNTCLPVLGILIKLVERLDGEYSARKREKGRVDFNDIELMTLKLLRDENGGPSETAKAVAKSVKIIIVDEFQDSNEIQYEIFRLISDNKQNLFFVGDIKQSIYRFRGADPHVFSRLTKDPDFTVIDLNTNFRSCAEVINSVNGIFMGTMTEALGDVDYDRKCALVQGASYDTGAENRTELITFGGKNAEDSRKNEASYIADRIRQMTAGGFAVTDHGVKRPCRYGDFAVLMGRYSTNIEIYIAAFDKAGIPYDAKDTEEYTDFSDVKHTISLLKVIDDPYSDADLAAVLMREPYMLTENDMADIKLAAGHGKSLWTGLNRYAARNKHAAAVLHEINGFRRFAEENSAERLIRKICDESMLVPAAEVSPNGAKRSTNLRKLIYYAEMFSGGESASLYDFICYMDNIRKGKITLTQAKGESTGAVRMMTIHGSKGLEFPVCFVSNLSSRPRNISEEIICDPECGIGMKVCDSERMLKINTQTYKMVSDENTRLNLSEEMRLLYVAATRAKEKLIFTAPMTRGEPGLHYGWVLNSRAVKNGLIDVRNYVEYTPSDEADAATGDDSDEITLPEFTEYRHSAVSRVPAKVTATQIGVKSVDDYAVSSDKIERFMRLPSFLAKTTSARLTGKKRGDAYHKVMEMLDFSAKTDDVPRILDELCENGKISDTERLTVSETDISAFLTSDLCKRAAKSGDVNREFPIFCEYTPEAGEWDIADWDGEEKPFIQGIADMFFVEDGEIVLVDYKTNSSTTADTLIEEYRGQLEIYARALSEATGMRVKQKLLYSFELGQIEVD
ncbi:MAG: UvrD-helicase domain-containing protein [Ruminiclostridium sp.]|nr:UvrD-helicase domain-containing protein [Ruminiclostridium sp.]